MPPSRSATPGEIDYRLARRQRLNAFRKGRLARHDVCDAQPELLRAARNVGKVTTELCPVCEEADLVHVSYVFGPGMPAHGRCVTTATELRQLGRTGADRACYVVEVCPECAWNHLIRTYLLAPSRPARSVSTARR